MDHFFKGFFSLPTSQNMPHTFLHTNKTYLLGKYVGQKRTELRCLKGDSYHPAHCPTNRICIYLLWLLRSNLQLQSPQKVTSHPENKREHQTLNVKRKQQPPLLPGRFKKNNKGTRLCSVAGDFQLLKASPRTSLIWTTCL